jgi:MFS family permease
LLGGGVAQYAPLPLTLPYLVYVLLVAGLAVGVARVPHCPHLASTGRHAFPTIPAAIRRPFFIASVESFVSWATFAIFVSLLPSFLARSLDVHNLMLGAIVVTCLQTGMVSASFVGRRLGNRAAIVTSMLALTGGMWLLLLAVPLHAYAVLILATFVVGAGGGLSYLAGLNIVGAIAPPEHRAEVTSAFFVACYLGFSVPALGVGIAANRFGLYDSIVGGAALLGIIAVTMLVLTTERNLTRAPG